MFFIEALDKVPHQFRPDDTIFRTAVARCGKQTNQREHRLTPASHWWKVCHVILLARCDWSREKYEREQCNAAGDDGDGTEWRTDSSAPIHLRVHVDMSSLSTAILTRSSWFDMKRPFLRLTANFINRQKVTGGTCNRQPDWGGVILGILFNFTKCGSVYYWI